MHEVPGLRNVTGRQPTTVPTVGDWAVSAADALVLRSVRQTTDSSSRREIRASQRPAMDGAACRDPHDEGWASFPLYSRIHRGCA
jgi:hypothetical protein